MKTKVLSLIFAIIFTLTASVNVLANNSSNQRTLLYDNNQIITPDAEEVCEGYPSHDMVSRGWGTAYLGTNPDTSNCILNNANCWQCSRCNYVIITQGDPCAVNGTIGTYVTWPAEYPISAYGCVVWVNASYYTSSNRLSWCSFRYAF